MKRQTRASRLDESLGERRGKKSTKKQSYSARRDESRGMSKEHMKEYAKYSPRQLSKHMKEEKKLLAKKKEAAAGRSYNRSTKHRRAESRGMKKAMRGR